LRRKKKTRAIYTNTSYSCIRQRSRTCPRSISAQRRGENENALFAEKILPMLAGARRMFSSQVPARNEACFVYGARHFLSITAAEKAEKQQQLGGLFVAVIFRYGRFLWLLFVLSALVYNLPARSLIIP